MVLKIKPIPTLSEPTVGRREKPFRFSFSAADKYRPPATLRRGRPLFRRWEAAGLLLLVTVGAAFIPSHRHEPAMGTLLMEAAARGSLRARFFSLAPPLLALMFAVRASSRLAQPFRRFRSVSIVATLSALAVFLAFQIGLYLALQGQTAGHLPPPDWIATVPGALAGWALLLLVASIRLLASRARRDLKTAQQAMDRESGPHH